MSLLTDGQGVENPLTLRSSTSTLPSGAGHGPSSKEDRQIVTIKESSTLGEISAKARAGSGSEGSEGDSDEIEIDFHTQMYIVKGCFDILVRIIESGP